MIDANRTNCAATAHIAGTAKFVGRGSVLIGEFCTLEDHVLLDTGERPDSQIIIGNRSRIKQGAVLRTYDGHIELGSRVTVGEYSILAGHGGLYIGNAVIIAGHCYFTAADHIFDGAIPLRFQGETARGIRVGHGAWFGARCVVLDGIQVGDNCAIGAGSVVTQDLSANMLCVGVPCREKRPRREMDHVDW